MSQRPGIREVANAAGVSVTTVSHAMNGRGKVSASTRELVRGIAAELGYAPNRIASALRSNLTDIVGFVSDQIATTPYAGRIVLGAQQAAAEHGMTMMVVDSNSDEEVERRQVEVLLAQQVDALIYATMFHRPAVIPIVPSNTPVILVNSVDPARDLPAFVPDEYQLAQTATRALIDAGHTRIAHLTIDAPGFGTDRRIDGFRDTMQSAGLKAHIVAVPGPAAGRAGRIAFLRALEQRPDLTAVFCFNDPMAMGVYQVAADRGVDIPGRLSVIGVDDLEIIAAELRPGLTTIALPHYEMGRRAVLEAVRRIQTDTGTEAEIVRLPCELVVRASVQRPS